VSSAVISLERPKEESAIPPERIRELKDKFPHSDLSLITAPTGEVVVLRNPSREEWRRFKVKAADERKRSDAMEQLLSICVVEPSAVALDSMLEKRPALLETFCDELFEMAGLAKRDVEKKAL
jgi:hypothetical protein